MALYVIPMAIAVRASDMEGAVAAGREALRHALPEATLQEETGPGSDPSVVGLGRPQAVREVAGADWLQVFPEVHVSAR